MGKRWCIVLVFILLLLTGCSQESWPEDRPFALEVGYGQSTVYAQTSEYAWYWKDGRETASAVVDTGLAGLTANKIPYLNATADTALQLKFDQAPDKLLVTAYSAADGYASGQQVDVVGNSMPAPLDGKDHLYTVTAVWMESDERAGWGSSTYCFRFLSEGRVITSNIQMEVAADLDLTGLLQLAPTDLWGVEFVNNLEGTTKTCRSSADKTAILQFFQANLSPNLQSMTEAEPQSEYLLRLVTVTGQQLTVAYGGSYTTPCVTVGGVPYVVNALDFGSLWSGLSAGSLSQEAAAAGKNYLETSEAFPGDDWGSEFVYGYLRQLDQSVTYDEVRWIEDAAEPNGFRLENGWTGQSAVLAADCQFWLLEDHAGPYCRVTAEELWQWCQDAEMDVLYRIYTSGGEVTAVCQQYLP